MTEPSVTIETSGNGTRVGLAGSLVIASIEAVQRELARLDAGRPVTVDLAAVDAFDTAGAWLVTTLRLRLEAEGTTLTLTGASDEQRLLLDTVANSLVQEVPSEPPPTGFIPWLATLGRWTAATAGLLVELLNFLGLVMVRLFGVLIRPWRFRLISLVHHMQESGFNAVPIVALMTFLIGVVIGFQGAAQLRQFGAEVFVVDLIAVSILRELGILLTAIVVAGRSASAFTAAVGSMKMREEIDAMRTLGLDPIEILVLPRLLALLIMLPLLGFIGNMMGLVGGAVMAWIELGVSPNVFRARLLEGTDVSHFLVGMVKAPFFAIIIAVVGCFEGMKVEMNAESLGRRTSTSVVLAIFLVIVVNALFSIFFAIMEI